MNYPTCNSNRFDGLKFQSKLTRNDLAACLWWWRMTAPSNEHEKENAAWWADRGYVTHGIEQQIRIVLEPSAFFYEFAVRAGLAEYRGRWIDLDREDQDRISLVHGVASGSLTIENSRSIIRTDFNAPREELARISLDGKLGTKSPRKKSSPWRLLEAMDEDFFKVKSGGLSDSERSQKSKVHREVVALIKRAEAEGFASILV